jgi:hypothetical protein
MLKKTFEPKNEEVARGRRIMISFSIIRGIKSRRMRRAGHAARMAENRNAYRGLVETGASGHFPQAHKMVRSRNIFHVVTNLDSASEIIQFQAWSELFVTPKYNFKKGPRQYIVT